MTGFIDLPVDVLDTILGYTYIPITLCKKMSEEKLSTFVLPKLDFGDTLIEYIIDELDFDVLLHKSYSMFKLFNKPLINHVYIPNNKNLVCIPENIVIKNMYVEGGFIPSELSFRNISNLTLREVDTNNFVLKSIIISDSPNLPKYMLNQIIKYTDFTFHEDDEEYFAGETDEETREEIICSHAEFMGGIKKLPNLISLNLLRCSPTPHVRSLENLLHLTIIKDSKYREETIFISYLPSLLSLNVEQKAPDANIIITDINPNIKTIVIKGNVNMENIFVPLTVDCGNKLETFSYGQKIENKKLEDILKLNGIIFSFCGYQKLNGIMF